MNTPTLIPQWKEVLTRAWSVKLLLLAGALSGVEAILPSLVDVFPGPTFAIFQALVVCAALIARVTSQSGLSDEA